LGQTTTQEYVVTARSAVEGEKTPDKQTFRVKNAPQYKKMWIMDPFAAKPELQMETVFVPQVRLSVYAVDPIDYADYDEYTSKMHTYKSKKKDKKQEQVKNVRPIPPGKKIAEVAVDIKQEEEEIKEKPKTPSASSSTNKSKQKQRQSKGKKNKKGKKQQEETETNEEETTGAEVKEVKQITKTRPKASLTPFDLSPYLAENKGFGHLIVVGEIDEKYITEEKEDKKAVPRFFYGFKQEPELDWFYWIQRTNLFIRTWVPTCPSIPSKDEMEVEGEENKKIENKGLVLVYNLQNAQPVPDTQVTLGTRESKLKTNNEGSLLLDLSDQLVHKELPKEQKELKNESDEKAKEEFELKKQIFGKERLRQKNFNCKKWQ